MATITERMSYGKKNNICSLSALGHRLLETAVYLMTNTQRSVTIQLVVEKAIFPPQHQHMAKLDTHLQYPA